jgi:pilus assembly protein CpaC
MSDGERAMNRPHELPRRQPLHAALIAACTVLGAFASGAATAQATAEGAAVRARSAPGAAAAGQVPRAALERAGSATRASASAASAAAPARTAASDGATAADTGPSCQGGLPDPMRVRLSVGRSTLVNLPEPITRRTLGDPEVAEGRMVSPSVLYLNAGRIGSTNAILQGASGRCIVLDVVVAIDIESVQAKIAELMPTERNIRVAAAADSLVLSGTVSDAMAADRAVMIANAFVRTPYQQGLSTTGAAGNAAQSRMAIQRAEAGGAPVLARVVNLLGIEASQQVMLEVKVAEVSKTLLDKLGAQFGASKTNGSWTYQILGSFLSDSGGVIGAFKDQANRLLLDAEKRDGLVRILAEPNLMAISGQEGSFLAGGQILIPVAQSDAGFGGVTRITLEEKDFGVGLKFTPTVLSDGRIHMKVAPEVSELSREGVGITTPGTLLGGRSVFPLITTRRAATTVQLRDGQSFAIGGLIKNSSAGSIKAFPILGEVPILGALFRSTEFQSEKTELVFIVTPRLVKPLPAVVTLPTDAVGETDRTRLFLGGQLDSPGRGPAPLTAPAPAPVAGQGGMELK